MEQNMDIGLIGLAVMGENLALNIESRGFSVAVYNRTPEKTDAFINGRGKGKHFLACHTVSELTASLSRPRKIMMMVKAGDAVDALIEQLLPTLEPGDILIDGGNSFYRDTQRRCDMLAQHRIRYVGAGISGGEEGALHGPSIMPGGDVSAWEYLKPIFQAIAAKAPDGTPCCEWVGAGGSGHFVKTVHNGIEYADMQMISEAYFLMKELYAYSPSETAEIFETWNQGVLNSYLIEITAEILKKTDPKTGKPILDLILDTAGQKGTGKWTAQAALDLGVPAMTIADAVFARCASSMKEDREYGATVLTPPAVPPFQTTDRKEFAAYLHDALYASKICSYAQGFGILRAASDEFGWNLDYAVIASLWRGGCIIRAAFLDDISAAFRTETGLKNLLFAPFFRKALGNRVQAAWRLIVQQAILSGLPLPAFTGALTYYDSCRTARLPANLIQAQRDYFGAHTFERTDAPRGHFFHFEWTPESGKTTSTSYQA